MALSVQVPTVGLANSTEAVKVTNSLTNLNVWANGNIAGTDLSPTAGIVRGQVTSVPSPLTFRNGGVNLNANIGDWVPAAAGVTVNLPTAAGHASGIVGVVANSGVSSASPVTVAASAIYGPGLSNAGSFVLGSPMASVVLQSDGSSWFMISGQQDTGWVALSFAANVSATGGAYTPSARLQGDTVRLKGGLTASAGFAGGTLATIPAGLRPTAPINLNSGVGWPVSIAGLLGGANSGAGTFDLAGFNFPIS